jgi:hypothetical protein
MHKFQHCGHTCNHDEAAATTKSRRPPHLRGCFIMHTEGSALLRHLQSRPMHPSCKKGECPAHSILCGVDCVCDGDALPVVRSRDPTHEEWVRWGQVLYGSLQKDDKKDQWPVYYKDMALGGPQPPAPNPSINVWNTPPPQTETPQTSTPIPPPASGQPQHQTPGAHPTTNLEATPTAAQSGPTPPNSPIGGNALPPALIPSQHPTSLATPTIPSGRQEHRLRSVVSPAPVPGASNSQGASADIQSVHRRREVERAKPFSTVVVEEISRSHLSDKYDSSFEWGHVTLGKELAEKMLLGCPGNIVADGSGEDKNGETGYYVREHVSSLFLFPLGLFHSKYCF